MDGCEQISQEWSSLSGLYTAEEDDFMSQMLGNFNLEIPSALWPAHESTVMTVTGISNSSYFPVNGDNCNTNYFQFSQGSSYMSMSFDAKLSPYSVQGNNSMNEITDNELGIEVIGDKNLQAHKECEILVSESTEEDINSNVEKPGKRSRSSIEVGKNKRNVKSMKKAKSGSVSNSGEDRSPGFQGQNLSSSCSEEDEANVSEELNGGGSSSLSPEDSTTLKGKSKSTRGSATDPQSVYARRRRERINERLRILQNLVPNGTKVDISTMLEEAVQYVKFLQLQIKLLSSDDLWMYAPIAYNGMNIGLDLNISPTKQP